MRLPDEPSVLVLLVATDGATWLPDVLQGLRAQQHRPIKVLAVDNASTDGSSELLEKAFGANRVVTLERRAGYGRALASALKVAADRDLAADAFLLLHDDAVLEPGAIEAMVAALDDDGVGIVGAKLVDWDDPRVLQDVGQTTDRYGRVMGLVDRGEIDQGQHAGTRDVLYVSSAAMLIARPVVETLGLFDLSYVALRDDLDLCWRARNANFRTVITGDATVRHAAALARDLRVSSVQRRVRYFGDRNMIATLIKNYSLPRLALALPVTIAISMVNVVLYLARGRRASALQVLEALQWNIVHLPATLRARHRAQKERRVGDADVVALMHHGATRVRAQVERAVETIIGDVEEGDEGDLDAPPPRLVDRVRAHPGGLALAVFAVIGLLGARSLFGVGALAGRELGAFPGASGFLSEFASGWRGSTTGGAGPATPALVVLAVVTFLSFASGWLAQRVVLFGLPVVAAFGMRRVARVLGLGPAGTRLAIVAFAASPLVLGAFGAGRLPDLVLAAAAPYLVLPLLRAAGVAPSAGWRSASAGVAGLALAAAFAPWALLFILGAGAVLAVVAARLGTARPSAVLARAGIMIGGALVLLVPWSLELFRSGSPLMGGGVDATPGVVDLLALSPGFVHPVPIMLGLGIAAAATVGMIVAPPERSALARAAGALTFAGLMLAWAVARGVPWIAARPGLPLTAAAFGAAILAAIALDRAGPALQPKTFGAAHVVAGVVGIAVALQFAVVAEWIAFGSRPGLVASGSLVPTFFADEAASTGTFRVAWIDGDLRRPVIALSDEDGQSMRSYLVRTAGAGAATLEQVGAQIASGSSQLAARELATLGVRYVIVRPGASAALQERVASQADFEFRQGFHGASVFANHAGLPAAAALASEGWVAAARGPLDALGAVEATPGPVEGLQRTGPGVFAGTLQGGDVVLAEDFSAGWRLEVGGKVFPPARSFGWATRFEIPAGEGGEVAIVWGGQRTHRAMILLEVLLVLAFLAWRSQRVARERGES